jgi:hypothetical protein
MSCAAYLGLQHPISRYEDVYPGSGFRVAQAAVKTLSTSTSSVANTGKPVKQDTVRLRVRINETISPPLTHRSHRASSVSSAHNMSWATRRGLYHSLHIICPIRWSWSIRRVDGRVGRDCRLMSRNIVDQTCGRIYRPALCYLIVSGFSSPQLELTIDSSQRPHV